MGNKMKPNNKKHKNIKHNSQEESSRAVFGEPKGKDHNPHDFEI